MNLILPDFSKAKKKYLSFLKSQEIPGHTFKDKLKQFNNFYIPICKRIYKIYNKNKKTIIIGLAGGQGIGKSTISNILKIILKENFDLTTVTFSIDDFYKTSYQRKKMSEKVCNLFLTRGVPGTHDDRMLFSCLNGLKKKRFKKILIPKFDKSTDNRLKKNKWIKILKKPDIVIFEGWCVGAKAQKKSSLIKPINLLEREEDKDMKWRIKVNQHLEKNYKRIFNLIDLLIFLKIPSFNYVYKWRYLQEKKLKKNSNGSKVMNSKQIKRFIMFYERITKQMLKITEPKSKIQINVGSNHSLRSIKFN